MEWIEWTYPKMAKTSSSIYAYELMGSVEPWWQQQQKTVQDDADDRHEWNGMTKCGVKNSTCINKIHMKINWSTATMSKSV